MASAYYVPDEQTEQYMAREHFTSADSQPVFKTKTISPGQVPSNGFFILCQTCMDSTTLGMIADTLMYAERIAGNKFVCFYGVRSLHEVRRTRPRRS